MNISQTVQMALDLSEQAFEKLGDSGAVRKEINSVIDNAVDSMIYTVNGFIDYVLDYLQNGFATCGPLMDVYDLVDNTICYRILSPFNGIWTGFGLYLILSIPILIMSCMLEPLFRRYKKAAYQKEDHIEMMGNFLSY